MTRPPIPPPEPAGAPREEQLRRGTRRGFEGERAVGLVEVLGEGDGQPARARLSVAAGPAYLEALLPAGGSVEVGGQRLEVAALEPPRAIRIRLHPGAPAGAPLRPVETPGPRWRLAGLALHELPGGVQVGVGNVRREGRGPAAAVRVTLTVFPADYARDPGQGYDRHLDLSAGQALEGQVLRGRVVALDPGPEPGGTVELELLPP